MNSEQFDVILPVLIEHKVQIPMTMVAIDLLKKHTPNMNLIIIESSNYFEDYADEHIELSDPLTYAKKVNIGLKKAKSDKIIVTSNDIYVTHGYTEALMKCFEDEKCGVATLLSSQFHEDKRDLIEEGFFGGLWMVSRECLNKVGYLDERFINSFEDADYWVRVKLAGYKLLINRACEIEHLVSKTICHHEKHSENFSFGQRLFRQKHHTCGLELYERLR